MAGGGVRKGESLLTRKPRKGSGISPGAAIRSEIGAYAREAKAAKGSTSLLPWADVQLGELIDSGSFGCVYEGTWKFGKLVASKLVLQTAQDAAYYGAFDKFGRPTGAGAFAFGSGVSLAGTYMAPPVEEAEGDEPPPVLPAPIVPHLPLTEMGMVLVPPATTTSSVFLNEPNWLG